ncbi:hypothetical protein RQP46_010119 [Phenoliferia psychrophenolica]
MLRSSLPTSVSIPRRAMLPHSRTFYTERDLTFGPTRAQVVRYVVLGLVFVVATTCYAECEFGRGFPLLH